MTTAWFNLGAWRDARHYDEACAALARRLAVRAQLGPDQRVLDVGSGSSQQDKLFLEEFGVTEIHALEPDEDARARAPSSPRLHLTGGDGADLSRWPDGSFDRVLSLDAAYHFSSRARFLAEAARVLRPGGRLAVIDIALTRAARRHERVLARAAGVPRENLWTVDEVLPALGRAGLREAELEQQDDVLDGFARWATGSLEWGSVFSAAQWPKVLATGLALRVARHPVRVVLYTALRA